LSPFPAEPGEDEDQERRDDLDVDTEGGIVQLMGYLCLGLPAFILDEEPGRGLSALRSLGSLLDHLLQILDSAGALAQAVLREYLVQQVLSQVIAAEVRRVTCALKWVLEVCQDAPVDQAADRAGRAPEHLRTAFDQGPRLTIGLGEAHVPEARGGEDADIRIVLIEMVAAKSLHRRHMEQAQYQK